MESLERVIVEHPFFREFNPEQLSILTGCASNVRFESGSFIFREGTPANHFYIVRQGRVALEMPFPGDPLIVQTIDDGEVFGWSWLVPPYEWRFNARALTMTRAIALDGKCLRGKCEIDHSLGYALMKKFAQVMQERLQTAMLQFTDVYAR